MVFGGEDDHTGVSIDCPGQSGTLFRKLLYKDVQNLMHYQRISY